MFLRECRTSVSALKGIGTVAASTLAGLGVTQVRHFLEYYPRRYLDRMKTVPFSLFQSAEVNTKAVVTARDYIFFKGRKVLKVYLRDESANAVLVCFGRNFLENKLVQDTEILVAGRFQYKFGEIQSSAFDFELADENPGRFRKILPVYPLSGKLTQGIIRSAMKSAVDEYARFLENEIPAHLRQKYSLIEKAEALKQIHFPENSGLLDKAVYTLKFEELFFNQLALGRRALSVKTRGPAPEFKGGLYKKVVSSLPFELTGDQIKAINEIKNDLGGGMNRLLQGDVGSGKTLIALLCCCFIIENKGQCAFMAPTELLAEQHALNASDLLSPKGINVAYLTGGTNSAGRRQLLKALENGDIDLLVGTHSLFSDDLKYCDLRLIVIDEQQRFGVEQKKRLIEKSPNPDILLMTATPIPRTLALTVFGDLEISTVREMPGGRKPVITHLARQGNEKKVYDFVDRELRAGRQAYFVYPLLAESGNADLKAAETMAEELSKRYPDFNCGLAHGKLKDEEKSEVMRAFKNKEIQVLVATSVVEVGVDVANATCMVIEHAERFGLSALHQLRGRVGRSGLQSYAFLVYGKVLNEDGKSRLKIMKQSSDGFKIAEEDLKIRGPGELLGIKQSGYIPFKIADMVEDLELLLKCRDLCGEILACDPGLIGPRHSLLREALNKNLDD